MDKSGKPVVMQCLIGWFLSLVLVLIISQSVESRRLDCTKFVFAPRCRGVAAKRALGAAASYDPKDKRHGGDTAALDYSDDSAASNSLLPLDAPWPRDSTRDVATARLLRAELRRELAAERRRLDAQSWPAVDGEYQDNA